VKGSLSVARCPAPLLRQFRQSSLAFYASMALAGVLAIVTAWGLYFRERVLGRAIVGAVVIAYLFGLEVSHRIVDPRNPAAQNRMDLKQGLSNMGAFYFWIAILCLCVGLVCDALIFYGKAMFYLLR
jgi:hypothetical protein